jgi:transposase
MNRLDFSSISKINLEDMTEVRRGRRQSRRTSYFNPGAINERLMQKAESLGVQVELTSCTYRSQRCHKCGWVQKANRSGKKITCKKCGEIEDADLNAARNLAEDLVPIPTWMRRQQLNLKGFYWIVGQEPESLIPPNEVD